MIGNSDRERQEHAQHRNHPGAQPLPSEARDDMRGGMSARATLAILNAIDELSLDIRELRKSMEKHMAKIDDQLDAMLATATAEDGKIDSIIALLGSLSQPLGLTAEQQTKLDAIMAAMADNPDRIQAAIDAVPKPE